MYSKTMPGSDLILLQLMLESLSGKDCMTILGKCSASFDCIVGLKHRHLPLLFPPVCKANTDPAKRVRCLASNERLYRDRAANLLRFHFLSIQSWR